MLVGVASTATQKRLFPRLIALLWLGYTVKYNDWITPPAPDNVLAHVRKNFEAQNKIYQCTTGYDSKGRSLNRDHVLKNPFRMSPKSTSSTQF